MTNPVSEFLKYASGVKVRSHARVEPSGNLTYVRQHERQIAAGEDIDLPEDDELQMDIEDVAPPIDLKDPLLKARQAKEIEMWRKWKEGGMQQEDLKPLLVSFRPLIKKKTNIYARKVRIPPSAIEATFQIEFVNALKSYDPSKGALGTYVFTYLDRGRRWIGENQNIGRIPENRLYKIREYQSALEELGEDLGRVPNHSELSHRLGWTLAEVDRMESELRTDLVSQAFEEDPFSITPSKSEEVMRLFRYELEGDQLAVYDYIIGHKKTPINSTSEIAKKMGIKDYQVSRIKNQIRSKLTKYIEE